MDIFGRSKKELNVTATIDFDREYFDDFYDHWLAYRSLWQRYALALTLTVAASAIVAMLTLPDYRFIASGLLVAAAFYAIDAGTHRTRWIHRRIKNAAPGKSASFDFSDDNVRISTRHSESNLQYKGFVDSTVTPTGLFLVPENGILVFIPQSAFESEDDFKTMSAKIDELN